jgi:uncharacterized protein Yka (UPF0111/DUF47 family)
VGENYQFAVARFTAADAAQCREYLNFLGSRLVFLIDWNRARKQLRDFLPNDARLRVLRWAAETEVGHRAFLELGGSRLINQAIEANAGSAIHFGDRLSDVLGVSETEFFLRFALRSAAEGMLARQSAALIRDRIGIELSRHFANEERRLLRLAAEHAGLIHELALLAHAAILAAMEGEDGLYRLAARARALEHDADAICQDVHRAVKRRPDHAAFAPLLRDADDAADGLEEAVFPRTTCAQGGSNGELAEELLSVAALLVAMVQAWVRVLAHADHVHDPGTAEDIDDLLTALDQVLALEHQVDDAQRALTTAAIQHAGDFRELHLCTAIGGRLEDAADALKRCSLMVRDQVLEDVLNG